MSDTPILSFRKPTLAKMPHDLTGAESLSDEAKQLGGGIVDAGISKMAEILDKAVIEGSRIRASQQLTPVGKSEAIADLHEQTKATIEANTKNQFAASDQIVRQKEAAIPTELPKPPKDLLEFAAHQEIRQYLRCMKTLDRQAALKIASSGGATEILRAFWNDPVGQIAPLATESDKANLLDTWRRSTHPAAYDELDAALEVQQTLRFNLQTALKKIGKVAGVNPIQELATSKAN